MGLYLGPIRGHGSIYERKSDYDKKKVSILLPLHQSFQDPPPSPTPNQFPLIQRKKSKKWAQSCGPQRSLSQRRGEVRAHAPGFHRCRQVAGSFFFIPRFPCVRDSHLGLCLTLPLDAETDNVAKENPSLISKQSQHTCTLCKDGGQLASVKRQHSI